VHPRKADYAYTIPVESDEFRCACDGRLRVYRTRNAGSSWEPLLRGLPQKSAYETVLRDALTADSCDPVGLYFGTRSGQLFGSRDEGKSWRKLLEGLPAILCLRCTVLDDGSGPAKPKLVRSRGSAMKRTSRAIPRSAKAKRRRG
jgi:hypothetical protein